MAGIGISFLQLLFGEVDQPWLSRVKTYDDEVARRRVGVRCKEVGMNKSGDGTSSNIWSLL